MKATWRAKFNALSAMNDGHQFITIKRYNNTYIVYLSDILETRKYICPSCGLIVRATKECSIACVECSDIEHGVIQKMEFQA